MACAAAVMAAALVFLIFCNDPEGAQWMPKCLLYTSTGLKCPSCGNTRALYNLMHGHIGEAFAYNPFAFVAAPLCAFIIYLLLFQPRWAPRRLATRLLVAYCILYAAWFAIRNLAGW